MRKAEHSDINYFVSAGRAFCEHTPYSFDEDGYSRMIHEIIKDPDSIVLVDGDPVRCHCAAKFVSSMYNPDEIVCRVFSTWGPGGLKCFRAVAKEAQRLGADFLLADSFIEPRVQRFYEKQGMRMADTVFIKELRYGH